MLEGGDTTEEQTTTSEPAIIVAQWTKVQRDSARYEERCQHDHIAHWWKQMGAKDHREQSSRHVESVSFPNRQIGQHFIWGQHQGSQTLKRTLRSGSYHPNLEHKDQNNE